MSEESHAHSFVSCPEKKEMAVGSISRRCARTFLQKRSARAGCGGCAKFGRWKMRRGLDGRTTGPSRRAQKRRRTFVLLRGGRKKSDRSFSLYTKDANSRMLAQRP